MLQQLVGTRGEFVAGDIWWRCYGINYQALAGCHPERLPRSFRTEHSVGGVIERSVALQESDDLPQRFDERYCRPPLRRRTNELDLRLLDLVQRLKGILDWLDDDRPCDLVEHTWQPLLRGENRRVADVRLHGKGDKWRTCPLWRETAVLLDQLLDTSPGQSVMDEPVFTSTTGVALTRFGIYKIVRRHVAHLDDTRVEPPGSSLGPRSRTVWQSDETLLEWLSSL